MPDRHDRKKVISGSGSNLQSIIDHIEQEGLPARIQIVVSNNQEAYGLTRAKNHHIACAVIKHQDYSNREDFDRELIRLLKDAGVDLIVLAGFMRILTASFLRAFENRIINIHPALLPAFPGTHVQQKAIDYGVKFSGCTVHFVDEGVDTGPIIIQKAVTWKLTISKIVMPLRCIIRPWTVNRNAKYPEENNVLCMI
ncbi:MAG: phosphoribosylglycinamide formyltransferase [Deltaproteobacteria bacterium HGW-Deltaproteobacteria-1]|nr:MAG: phosphoribosylglycinamide formyltransferase [Deltaproteobacteria bacterium HGW-Deltaproteobacteria-1]